MAPAARADQCILDDLVVDGSACIGFDCVCPEPNFSFDTLRLSENNLRIFFEDTSSSASFPRTDWQLRANDSSNGGKEGFFIDNLGQSAVDGSAQNNGEGVFGILNGAPAGSLRVDAQGDLGVGTTNAVLEIHVRDGDSPALRLEQDNSSGFTPQTWDVAGNEVGFFVRDATFGSTLPFRIRVGAPSSSIDIAGSGNVGLGTASPSERLHVSNGQLRVNATNAAIRMADFIQQMTGGVALVGLQNTAAASVNNESGFQFRMETTTQTRDAGRITAGFTSTTDASRTSALKFSTNDNGAFGERMRIVGAKIGIGVTSVAAANDIQHSNGAVLTTGGTWMSVSSRMAKNDIRELSSDDAARVLGGLQPVRFRYKLEPDEEYVGFVAEDVPDLVATGDRQHLNSMDIVAVVTKVVQQQQQTIDAQNATIAELTERLSKLEQQVKPQE